MEMDGGGPMDNPFKGMEGCGLLLLLLFILARGFMEEEPLSITQKPLQVGQSIHLLQRIEGAPE